MSQDQKYEVYKDYDEYGYKPYCIKCEKLTNQASWGYDYTTGKLGNSYCQNCEIRYSKTEDAWLCCKLTDEPIGYQFYFCSNKLVKGLVCDKEHSKTKKIEVVSNNRHPNKTSIHLTYKF
jgi:hypothetical protein